jgi:hypothetical protein
VVDILFPYSCGVYTYSTVVSVQQRGGARDARHGRPRGGRRRPSWRRDEPRIWSPSDANARQVRGTVRGACTRFLSSATFVPGALLDFAAFFSAAAPYGRSSPRPTLPTLAWVQRGGARHASPATRPGAFASACIQATVGDEGGVLKRSRLTSWTVLWRDACTAAPAGPHPQISAWSFGSEQGRIEWRRKQTHVAPKIYRHVLEDPRLTQGLKVFVIVSGHKAGCDTV